MGRRDFCGTHPVVVTRLIWLLILLSALTAAARPCPEYYALVENLTEGDLAALRPRADEGGHVEEVRRALRTANPWAEDVMHADSPEKLEKTLRALHDLAESGEITVAQLATAILRWEAAVDLPYDRENGAGSPIPLLTADGELTVEAHARFIQSGLMDSKWDFGQTRREMATQLRNAVKLLPPSERYFFIYAYPAQFLGPDARATSLEIPEWANLMSGLLYRTSDLRPFFWRDVGDSHERLLIPSASVFEIILKQKFRTDVLVPAWQLGFTTDLQILSQARDGRRVVGLHFPGVAGPNYADTLRSGKFSFTYHDFYHLLIACESSAGTRNAMNASYSLLMPFADTPNAPVTLRLGGRDRTVKWSPFRLKIALQHVLDSEYGAAGKFGEALQFAFREKIEINDDEIASPDGKLLFLMHMAQNPRPYELWLRKPIREIFTEMELARWDKSEGSYLAILAASVAAATTKLPPP